MEVVPRVIEYYVTTSGHIPYREWFESLAIKVQVAVDRRLTRIESGLIGDCKHISGGVLELRIDSGPGYRIYFGQRGRAVILLLCGGDKSSQKKDIQSAKKYWTDYLGRNEK